jgi:hypothetical protein
MDLLIFASLTRDVSSSEVPVAGPLQPGKSRAPTKNNRRKGVVGKRFTGFGIVYLLHY